MIVVIMKNCRAFRSHHDPGIMITGIKITGIEGAGLGDWSAEEDEKGRTAVEFRAGSRE
jgi:hypothetical protein